jgi:Fe-Mn family superoxide dismutase
MLAISRRRLFQLSGAGAGAVLLGLPALPVLAQAKKENLFELAPLPYEKGALEPHIDAQTMEIHHGRHHQAYVNNLNKALLAKGADWLGKPMEEILRNLDKIDAGIRVAIRNNGGGHYNHTIFWNMMCAARTSGQPSEGLLGAIKQKFESLEGFFERFKTAAMGRFGSGWAWLVANRQGQVDVVTTEYQDNPIMQGMWYPILGIDVWEHAYYLKYQNRRDNYIDAFKNVINWRYVSERFETAKRG